MLSHRTGRAQDCRNPLAIGYVENVIPRPIAAGGVGIGDRDPENLVLHGQPTERSDLGHRGRPIVGDHEQNHPPPERCGHVSERTLQVGVRRRESCSTPHDLQHPLEVRLGRFRASVHGRLGITRDQSHQVAVASGEVADRSRHSDGEIRLSLTALGEGSHRPAGIGDDEHGVFAGGNVTTGHRRAHSGCRFPVDIRHSIAWHVGAHVVEVDAATMPDRGVLAFEETAHPAPGADREPRFHLREQRHHDCLPITAMAPPRTPRR